MEINNTKNKYINKSKLNLYKQVNKILNKQYKWYFRYYLNLKTKEVVFYNAFVKKKNIQITNLILNIAYRIDLSRRYIKIIRIKHT